MPTILCSFDSGIEFNAAGNRIYSYLRREACFMHLSNLINVKVHRSEGINCNALVGA